MNTYEEGLRLFQNGKVSSAIPIFKEVLQKDPINDKAAFVLGVCYFRNKELDKADALFCKTISVNNNHYKAHYYRGLIFERKNQIDAAKREFRIALTLKPDFKEAIEKLGSLNEAEPQLISPSKTIQSNTLDESEHLVAGDLILESNRRMRSYSFLFVLMITLLLFGIGLIIVASAYGLHKEPALTIISIGISLIIMIYLLIGSRTTKYAIYQRRIDFSIGVLFKKQVSLWIYEIEDTWITRTPFNLLTNDATVHFRVGSSSKIAPRTITGIGNHHFMHKLWEELRDSALVERRTMKKWWV